jgi:hypothetical protein
MNVTRAGTAADTRAVVVVDACAVVVGATEAGVVLVGAGADDDVGADLFFVELLQPTIRSVPAMARTTALRRLSVVMLEL